MTRTNNRALANMPNNFVSVLDYGADPTGTKNSYPAIQAAVDSGFNVIVPNGTYRCDSPIRIENKESFTLTGEGGIILAQGLADNTAVLLINQCKNSTFKDLYIQGNGVATGDGSIGLTNSTNAVLFMNNEYCVVDGFHISGVNYGIQAEQGNHNTISNNTINNVGRLGISIRQEDEAAVTNNTITDILGSYSNIKYGDGIYIFCCKNGLVDNNTIDNGTRIGIVLEWSDGRPKNDNMSIRNNTVRNFTVSYGTEINAGIWCEPYCSEKTCTIQGNKVQNCDPFGIYCNDAILVQDNILTDCNYAIDAQHVGLRAVNNTCIECTVGVRSRTSDHSIVVNNYFVNCTLGVSLNSNIPWNLVVSGNTFEDNEDGGILLNLRSCTEYEPSISIVNNTFITSADENDASLQPMGLNINGIPDGTSQYRYKNFIYFYDNAFIYSGNVPNTDFRTTAPNEVYLGGPGAYTFSGNNFVPSTDGRRQVGSITQLSGNLRTSKDGNYNNQITAFKSDSRYHANLELRATSQGNAIRSLTVDAHNGAVFPSTPLKLGIASNPWSSLTLKASDDTVYTITVAEDGTLTTNVATFEAATADVIEEDLSTEELAESNQALIQRLTDRIEQLEADHSKAMDNMNDSSY